MGLFDKYKHLKENRKKKKIEKSLKTVQNRKAIKEDRAAALDFFKNLDDVDVAVSALLQRFEYSLEHGINDTREKETAMEGICKFGANAIPYVQNHLVKTTKIAWPIKILNSVASEAQIIEILKSALNFEDVSFDQNAVDKNYDILCYLADYQFTDSVKTIGHFLKDPDERVRFACVEVLVRQEDDDLKSILEPFLSDDTNENRRLRMLIIDAFVKNNWRLEDPSKFDSELLVEGVFITKKGKLERRV